MDVERKDEKIVPSKTCVWEETWNLEAYVYKISETGQSKSISGWKAFAISNGLQIGDKCVWGDEALLFTLNVYYFIKIIVSSCFVCFPILFFCEEILWMKIIVFVFVYWMVRIVYENVLFIYFCLKTLFVGCCKVDIEVFIDGGSSNNKYNHVK